MVSYVERFETSRKENRRSGPCRVLGIMRGERRAENIRRMLAELQHHEGKTPLKFAAFLITEKLRYTPKELETMFASLWPCPRDEG